MKAKELNRKYCREDHIERGTFVELGQSRRNGVRDPHGAIYYYVPAGETTVFHKIDCDEYWCYHEGAPLEVWMIHPTGQVSVVKLGTRADCEPLLLLEKGVVFAAKSSKDASDGTFLSCITAPRFQQQGLTLFSPEEIQRQYPQAAAFFEK